MCDNPASLQELCLNGICDNFLDVFEEFYEPQRRSQSLEKCIYEKKFRFRDTDMFLYNELSEMLFNKLIERHMLCDETLNIFSEKNTRLRKVKIRKTRKITHDGLKILKQHKIVELDCVNFKTMSIDKIIECLSPWSLANMTIANLSKCTFIDTSRRSFMVQITELKNLRSLNLSYTELNQQSFQMICEDLKYLERLDISGTCIKDLSPLLRLSNQLTSLGISDLKAISSMMDIVMRLTSLRHLDISLVNETTENVEKDVINELLDDPQSLPELVSLEISGWRSVIDGLTLETYVLAHPKLKYLGIVMNAAAFEQIFTEINYKHYKHDLVVAGLASESQIKVTLRYHYEKPMYVQKALYHLFQLTASFNGARADIVELVLSAMGEHPTKFGVQVAATACLYNLTRGELSLRVFVVVHPSLLGRGVNLILNAMENFPDEYQLQKNSLLNLCSDRILQELTFDRFRCAKLVLDSLCAFDEMNMNRMAVAICSILAAKVSTAETSELGARPTYMRKLLAMVKGRVDMSLSDITLKFTLSALWNLTDESAATCTVFLEQGGASLFLTVLQTFREDNAIETKVLGLLNNIAEVETLRHSLMLNSLIGELYVLLKSQHIDVSYFAAGIIAHLASDGDDKWTVRQNSRMEMLRELESAVMQWKVPESEMVAYRSFKPFFPLLRRDMDYQVQLWAVWAIHHVCNKNRKCLFDF
ncbi:protein zyg-11 b [Holotrichia oblita]|uniref:Protein zyg-11 b n=1 Tax=Holotrichia oblita TaxID=644536 RepID=A0ACB9SIV0_HOLOL|nr:protein zyg-11 b [Holotrichia oblita]